MKKSINLKNKLSNLSYLLNRTYSLFLSILVLYLIYNGSFQSFKWYSFLIGLFIVISIFQKLYNFLKYTNELSLIERLEVTFLIALFFEVLTEASGRKLFPLIYIIAPIFFAYLGWQEAVLAVVLVTIIETTNHSNGIEVVPQLLILLISTFGLGYLIKRNENLKYGRKQLINSIRNVTNKIFKPARTTEQPDLTLPSSIIDKKLKSEIRSSIELLSELLSPHSVVLYIKGRDGFFEIEDFISSSEKYIDRSQKLHIRGGYLGWVVKTSTPILVGEIKNHKENLIYYTKNIPVKSILAVPLILKDGKNESVNEQDTIGILLVDSLKKDAFEEREKQIVMLISNKIVDTLIKFRMSEKIKLSLSGLTSFYEYTNKLSSTLELDAIIDHVVVVLGKAIGADIVGLTLKDKETNTSILKRTGIDRRLEIEEKTFPNLDTLVGLVSESQKYFYSEDLSAREKYRSVFGKEIDFAWGINKIKSIFIYPLKETKSSILQENENTIGSIIIGRKTEKAFSEEERNLIEIMCQEAANSISNSLTYNRAKELAIRDSLTGLYNHRYFQERLDHEIARSDRFPEI